jgi:hypothetical protein
MAMSDDEQEQAGRNAEVEKPEMQPVQVHNSLPSMKVKTPAKKKAKKLVHQVSSDDASDSDDMDAPSSSARKTSSKRKAPDTDEEDDYEEAPQAKKRATRSSRNGASTESGARPSRAAKVKAQAQLVISDSE